MEKVKSGLKNALGFVFSTGNLERREFGIDLIKSFATFFVLSVHYFLNNGFYKMKLNSGWMLPMIAFRWLFYIGVPLFLLSTGYLKRRTKFTPMHYIKQLPVIVTAVLVGIVTIIFKITALGEENPLFIWLRSVWTYDQPGYAWYINMYLCLALIMPFISYAWNAVESRRKKQLMIFVFLMLTAIPTEVNRWTVMESPEANIGFAPNYWTNIYAVTYFLIGAYISEYKPKIAKWKLIVILAECLIYLALRTYVTAEGRTFYMGVSAGYEDLIIVLTSTVFFLLFYDLKINVKPVKAVIASISSVTLGLYLLSWIYDTTIYPIFKAEDAFGELGSLYLTYFKIIPMSFLFSFLSASVINTFTKLITNPIIKFSSKKLNQ